MRNLAFRVVTVLFKLRDFFVPRRKVLFFGCGPRGYVPDAASPVGPLGRVYALDVHPLAVGHASDLIGRQGLSNVRVIQSDCDTGLPDGSVDCVLLQDTFHTLNDPRKILTELRRVLRPNGVLSFSVHHSPADEILAGMTQGGLIRLAGKGRRTYTSAPG